MQHVYDTGGKLINQLPVVKDPLEVYLRLELVNKTYWKEDETAEEFVARMRIVENYIRNG